MDDIKRKALEAAGYTVGTVDEFLFPDERVKEMLREVFDEVGFFISLPSQEKKDKLEDYLSDDEIDNLVTIVRKYVS